MGRPVTREVLRVDEFDVLYLDDLDHRKTTTLTAWKLWAASAEVTGTAPEREVTQDGAKLALVMGSATVFQLSVRNPRSRDQANATFCPACEVVFYPLRPGWAAREKQPRRRCHCGQPVRYVKLVKPASRFLLRVTP